MQSAQERIQAMTWDELEEMLAWMHDRREYRRACKQPSDGADNYFEYLVLAEMGQRKRA